MNMEYTTQNYYKNNLSLYNDYRALGWETQEAQTKRFEVLLKNVDLNNKSLLDVGCGLGDLYGFLKTFQVPVSYLGTDIMPDMIKKAKEKYPNGLFLHEDIFSKENADALFPEKAFDIIFSSGIFNLNDTSTNNLLRDALLTFKELASEKIVFNLLSKDSPNKENAYRYYDQKEIDNLLRLLKFDKNKFRFIQGYLPNDFSVIIDLL